MRFLVISLVSLHPNRSSCFCEGLELGRLVFDLAMDRFECDKFSVSQICRLGDKAMLKTFLVNNPEIDLDMMDPEGKIKIRRTIFTDNLIFLAVLM